MAASTVSGLAGAALASRPAFSTSFVRGGRVSARNLLMTRNLERNGRITCMTFPRDWLRRDLNVIGFGLIGWLAPSSVPVINGNSLTGLFFSSIGQELAHFPTPPAVDSQFWSDRALSLSACCVFLDYLDYSFLGPVWHSSQLLILRQNQGSCAKRCRIRRSDSWLILRSDSLK